MKECQENILVVDDEEVIRNVCCRSLEKKGYHIELAENGITALERMRNGIFEIVFTDLKMPIMSGVELLETIKRDYPYSEVIIMTAFATIQGAIDAMKKGAYDFILKPIKPDQIRHVAEKCFEKIQLGAENKLLRAANQKLRDLQRMKDKFIAITSHELRTPVSHLKGYLGILEDEIYYQLSQEEKSQCMQVVFDAIQDLEAIVTNMHNLIHIENGKLQLTTEPLDVNLLLEDVVNEYQLIAKKRNQSLIFKKNQSSLTIVADSSQIKGIFRELIQNAIKFTPDFGEIQVMANNDGEYCVVSVKDSGIGIDVSEQGKIFEKFYEVQDSKYHSSSKNNFMGGGLGLGLTSVRKIAMAHGGGVKVKSRKDAGSEFLVYLPLEKVDNKDEQ
ncbi:MAG: response regulator [bacterium]